MAEPFELSFLWTGAMNNTYRRAAGWTKAEKRKALWIGATLLLLVVVAITIGARLYSPDNFSHGVVGIYIGVVIGMIAGLGAARGNVWLAAQRQARSVEAQGEFTLRFGPDGVHIKSNLTDTNYDWKAITNVVDIGPGLALVVMEWGFIPVPAEALKSVTKDEALSRITTWRSA